MLKITFVGGNMEFLETILRAFVGFILLLILMRLLGKKQLGQVTYFTYITGVALGNIAGDMVVHRDIKLIDAVVGITFWAALTYVAEHITLKSSRARVFLNGEPTIVIKRGQVIEPSLRAQKINIDDLTMLLRGKNVFSIKDVEYAVMEPNGQLTVLKKEEQETVTKTDMGIPIKGRKYMPSKIIVDGKMVYKNLKELNIDEEWVYIQLKQSGINSVGDVLVAEIESDGSLYISRRA